MLAPGGAEPAFPAPGHALLLPLFIDGAQGDEGFSSSVAAARRGEADPLHPQLTQTSAPITLAAAHSCVAALQVSPI